MTWQRAVALSAVALLGIVLTAIDQADLLGADFARPPSLPPFPPLDFLSRLLL